MKTNHGLPRSREIYCVDMTRARAEELVPVLREQGRHPRIHRRLVRAEGIDVVGFVVVVDRSVRP